MTSKDIAESYSAAINNEIRHSGDIMLGGIGSYTKISDEEISRTETLIRRLHRQQMKSVLHPG